MVVSTTIAGNIPAAGDPFFSVAEELLDADVEAALAVEAEKEFAEDFDFDVGEDVGEGFEGAV